MGVKVKVHFVTKLTKINIILLVLVYIIYFMCMYKELVYDRISEPMASVPSMARDTIFWTRPRNSLCTKKNV